MVGAREEMSHGRGDRLGGTGDGDPAAASAPQAQTPSPDPVGGGRLLVWTGSAATRCCYTVGGRRTQSTGRGWRSTWPPRPLPSGRSDWGESDGSAKIGHVASSGGRPEWNPAGRLPSRRPTSMTARESRLPSMPLSRFCGGVDDPASDLRSCMRTRPRMRWRNAGLCGSGGWRPGWPDGGSNIRRSRRVTGGRWSGLPLVESVSASEDWH